MGGINMNKDIKLFVHNEKAYNNLVSVLKTNQMVAINHATGTGKSFILLKYLINNPDKKILFMAPTYPIIDQLLEEHMNDLGINRKDLPNLNSMIYLNILKSNIENIARHYDVII